MDVEAKNLRAYIEGYEDRYKVMSERFLKILSGITDANKIDERRQLALFKILQITDPIGFYGKKLKTGSRYERAHACRMLADFDAVDEIKNIERQLSSKDAELSYNAAMALSKLGDESAVSKFIIGCNENHNFSHRIVLQLLGEYNEDIKSLAGLIFRECDDYIKASVIKSISKYKFAEFEDIYLSSLKSRNVSLRVAATAALGALCNPKYERALIVTSNDKFWIVRNAAVKALGSLGSEDAVTAVVRALSDVEWWVRYNAARTLIKMEGGLEKIEAVLKGMDFYAADALKYALYRQE